jgi:hypothetical protein
MQKRAALQTPMKITTEWAVASLLGLKQDWPIAAVAYARDDLDPLSFIASGA